MSKFAVGDRVVKSPLTWRKNAFDEWGRGLGIGVIVEAPFRLEEASVDVRWPCGRCFEDISGLLPPPAEIELEVLSYLLNDIESIDSLVENNTGHSPFANMKSSVSSALIALSKMGFVQPLIYSASDMWEPLVIGPSTRIESVWFQATQGGRDCLYEHNR